MSLQIQNLSKSFSVRTLFTGVTFSVNKGERVALVGNNGSGKTTLMKIILGVEQPDEGSITHAKESKVGYLPQEIFLADDSKWNNEKETLTLWGLVIQAFEYLDVIKEKITRIEHRMSEGETSSALQDEYERLLAEFEKAGGYTWQAKTNRLLKGFGFPEDRFHDPLTTFSGGWQMRAYFARLLLTEPDFLLLDEPTNYLDISSIAFLEDYLSNYPGGILVVSHDRYFLDGLANSVVAIMPEGAKTFKGNYSGFLEAREMWAQEAAAAQERQDKERKRVERFVERFRYKSSKASQVQSRIKQLEKLEEIAQVRSVPKLGFSFPECEPSGEQVMKAENLSRAYGENVVLNEVSFTVNRKDRLAIIGENGAGKTTLMKILANEDIAWSGDLDLGYRVHFGYFAQDEEISFEAEETVWDRMLREAPMDAVPNLRKLLGAFLFSGDNIEKKVRVLSGGEKSRLGLARMMLRPCNLLLLDEPTNHLDISSREALLNALDDFPGTIIIVSHDRFFLDSLATRILAIENGKTIIYEGNYSQYLWAKKHRISEEVTTDSNSFGPVVPEAKQVARDTRKQQKQLSNKMQRLKRDIEAAEAKIGEKEEEMQSLEETLAQPPSDWDVDKLAQASNSHQHLNSELEQAMESWEDLNAQLEETEKQLNDLRGGLN